VEVMPLLRHAPCPVIASTVIINVYASSKRVILDTYQKLSLLVEVCRDHPIPIHWRQDALVNEKLLVRRWEFHGEIWSRHFRRVQ